MPQKYEGEFPKASEFEIQAVVYSVLSRNGNYKVRGEFPFPNQYGGKNARLDIVVFNNKFEWLCVVEVKKKNAPDAAEQIQRYSTMLPCPVIECRGMMEAARIRGAVTRAIRAADYEKLALGIADDAAQDGIYLTDQDGPAYDAPSYD